MATVDRTQIGLIYFYTDTKGAVKIGWTENEKSLRINFSQARKGNPHGLECRGAFSGSRIDETLLHLQFSKENISGEWFNATDAILTLCDTQSTVRVYVRKKKPVRKFSKYHGVSYDNSQDTWHWTLHYQGRSYSGGSVSEDYAAWCYDEKVREVGSDHIINNIAPQKKPARSLRNSSSRYAGVYLSRSGKWGAQIQAGRKRKYLGTYANEEDAARAYNRAIEEHGLNRPLNDVPSPNPAMEQKCLF